MIEYIEIEGFKSIKKLKLEMKPVNIFIGSNGAGKSNFVSFFKLVAAIFNRRLQKYVLEEKSDNILYFGRKTTEKLCGKLVFSENEGHNNAYNFTLAQTTEGGLYLGDEGSGYDVSHTDNSHNYLYEADLDESEFARSTRDRNTILQEFMKSMRVFHFHDTSATSWLRKECDIHDNRHLRPDGRNLPAFLYLLKQKHPIIYNRIVGTIKSVAPYIDDFILEPGNLNEAEIALRWVDTGDLESNFSAFQLSDGTLRFIALTTVLLQPNPPTVIIIDEPELGLHPFALAKLAGMIQTASSKAQIIISTQSVSLVDYFEPEDIVAVDRNKEENQSVFMRLSTEKLKVWLEDYTIGDLWQRNIINSAQPFMK